MHELDGEFSDYGVCLANGSWTSYFGALQRDEVDVFIAPAVDTYERRQAFQLLNTGT